MVILSVTCVHAAFFRLFSRRGASMRVMAMVHAFWCQLRIAEAVNMALGWIEWCSHLCRDLDQAS